MTDALEVSRNETGLVRIFQVDLTEPELDAILNPKRDAPPTEAAIAELVGLDWIDGTYAELFQSEDLGEMGLAGYLTQGAGISEKDIAPKRLKLAQAKGPLLVLYSKAFENFSGELMLQRHVSLVDAFAEDGMDITFQTLPSRAATEPANQAPTGANPHLSVFKAFLAMPAICIVLGLLIWLLTR